MRIERHVFGSVRGYATLARSPGLSDADCRTLESTSFGTPYNPAYRSSLPRSVAYLSRPLGIDRRAITRVLPGAPDDEGRPTLLFVTAVISASDWDHILEGDVRPLLRRTDIWSWNHSPNLAALNMNGVAPMRLQLSGAGSQRVLGLLLLIELSWSSQRVVVVQESNYSLDEVAAIERLLPQDARRSYSAAYRSLNPDLGVRFNCIAGGVPASGSNPARSLCGAKSPFALHLERMGIGDAAGPLLLDYVGFGQPRVQFEVMAEEDGPVVSTGTRAVAPPRRSITLMHSAVLALIAVTSLIIGGATGWISRQATLPEPAPPPAWDQVVAQAPGLAVSRSEGRVSAINAMMSKIDDLGLAETDAATKLRDELESCKMAAEAARARIDDAIVAIRAVAPNNPDASETARGKINGLEPLLDPPITSAFREWVRDRRRPTEDRFDRLANAIRARLTKRAARFTDLSAPANERKLMEAESLVGTFELLATLGEYADKLVNSDQRKTTEEFVHRQRQLHEAARAEAHASDQASVAGRLETLARAEREFEKAVETLNDSPNEDTAAEVVSKLRAFAGQQTSIGLKEALTHVAGVLETAWEAMTRRAWLESLRKQVDQIDKRLGDLKSDTRSQKTKDNLNRIQERLRELRADLDNIDLSSQTGRGRP